MMYKACVAESNPSLFYVTAFRHAVEREQIEGQIEGQVKMKSMPVDYLSTLALVVS